MPSKLPAGLGQGCTFPTALTRGLVLGLAGRACSLDWAFGLHRRLHDAYVRREDSCISCYVVAPHRRGESSNPWATRQVWVIHTARGWHNFGGLGLRYICPAPTTMEEQSLDRTTLATISLLEARLLRVEQILHGSKPVPATSPAGDSAVESLVNLERRFATLVSRFRVYADILKLCKQYAQAPVCMAFTAQAADCI